MCWVDTFFIMVIFVENRGVVSYGILWYPMVLGRIWQHIPFDVIERSSNGAVVVDLLGEGAGPR